jgi:hypothetical protein
MNTFHVLLVLLLAAFTNAAPLNSTAMATRAPPKRRCAQLTWIDKSATEIQGFDEDECAKLDHTVSRTGSALAVAYYLVSWDCRCRFYR